MPNRNKHFGLSYVSVHYPERTENFKASKITLDTEHFVVTICAAETNNVTSLFGCWSVLGEGRGVGCKLVPCEALNYPHESSGTKHV